MQMKNFIQQFEEAIEGVEPGSLSGDTDLAAMEQWDSLALITILAMVDAEYEVQVSGEELNGCRQVRDIYALVEKKVG